MSYGKDFGIVGFVRRKGMDFEFAEITGEGDVLLRRDVLITEENDFPVEERLAQRGERSGIDRFCEINSVDLSADGGRQGLQRKSGGCGRDRGGFQMLVDRKSTRLNSSH